MLGEIIKVLGAGLSLWNHKEANKYRDRLIGLEREWREETAKPREKQSDARLDNIEFEIRILAKSFAGSVADAAK